MSDDELNAENEQDLWAAAAEDLVKQKEMLRDAAGGKDEDAGIATEPEGDDDSSASLEPEIEAPDIPESSGGSAGSAVPGELDRILGLPLKVTVELGRSRMLINDLMQLGQGSVIELSKLVGDSLDVKINDQLIGKGEVVVINEKFGVRITEIATPQERVETMGD